MDLNGGQRSVALGAEFHARGHRVACCRADELFLAGKLPFHRAASLQGGKHAKIFGDHLLLAAEAAADALGKDVHVAGGQAEQITELLLRDKGRLRARAHVQPAVVAAPGDRTMRLKMHVLHARRRIRHLMHGIGLLEPGRDASDLAMDFDIDVALRLTALVVQDWRLWLHCRGGVEYGRQDFVIHHQRPTAASAAASVSETTAPTRWPAKRTTLSSM